MEGEAEALTRRAIDAALDGDVTALRLCLDRIAPPRRERLVNIELPAVATAEDVPAALGALLQAVAAGELTPGEGQAVAAIVERQRAAIELADIETRLRKLEESR